MACCANQSTQPNQVVTENPISIGEAITIPNAVIHEPMIDHIFKFIIIGEYSIGKTCLLLQFQEGTFKNEYQPTIGVEFGTKNIKISDKTIKLRIWDTAGSERFKCITRGYFRGSCGVIIAYDITDRNSFNKIDEWLEELKNYNPDNHIIMLVGNKCDMIERVVTQEEGRKKASEIGALFFECSAKTGENVNKLFFQLAESVLKEVRLGKIILDEDK